LDAPASSFPYRVGSSISRLATWLNRNIACRSDFGANTSAAHHLLIFSKVT
jgi:hypothetical protein